MKSLSKEDFRSALPEKYQPIGSFVSKITENNGPVRHFPEFIQTQRSTLPHFTK